MEHTRQPIRSGVILNICYKCYCLHLTLDGTEVRWNFVHGLFENAIYGGRVDNTYDLKVLKSYLLHYFDTNVVTGTQVS